MTRKLVLLVLVPIVLISCKEKKTNPILFNIQTVDTLESEIVNRKKIQYYNQDYEDYAKRYIEILYIISDSKFNGNMDSLENYTYGGLKYFKQNDTLDIKTFDEKGNKIITFMIYDEIQIPSKTNSKDSVRIQNVTSVFTKKTYIK